MIVVTARWYNYTYLPSQRSRLEIMIGLVRCWLTETRGYEALPALSLTSGCPRENLVMLSFSATQRTCSPQNTPDIRTHTNQAGDGARIDRRGHRTVAAAERLWAPAPGEKSHTTF